MKKTYKTPYIKVSKIIIKPLLTNSEPVLYGGSDGNTEGSTIEAGAKDDCLFFDNDEKDIY